MSTALDQFNTLVEARNQSERAIEGKGKLQNCVWVIQETNAQIQELAEAGALDLLPTELKQGLNAIWIELKDCQAAIEALAVYDLI